jgi:hypothetical protein
MQWIKFSVRSLAAKAMSYLFLPMCGLGVISLRDIIATDALKRKGKIARL